MDDSLYQGVNRNFNESMDGYRYHGVNGDFYYCVEDYLYHVGDSGYNIAVCIFICIIL